MGELGAFLKIDRKNVPYRDPTERIGDFKEFMLPRPVPELQAQGARCMECGVPFCHNGCPLGNLIPDWNDLVYREGWVVPEPPEVGTGRSVAVVGSGPAGMAAAQQLRRAGHRVVLFERDEAAGGLCRFGVPDFKIEKWLVERRVQQLVDEGVELRC